MYLAVAIPVFLIIYITFMYHVSSPSVKSQRPPVWEGILKVIFFCFGFIPLLCLWAGGPLFTLALLSYPSLWGVVITIIAWCISILLWKIEALSKLMDWLDN